MFIIKNAQLLELLDEYFTEETPCKGKRCLGYQNCDFGCSESYGETCAIQTVINAMNYYNSQSNK